LVFDVDFYLASVAVSWKKKHVKPGTFARHLHGIWFFEGIWCRKANPQPHLGVDFDFDGFEVWVTQRVIPTALWEQFHPHIFWKLFFKTIPGTSFRNFPPHRPTMVHFGGTFLSTDQRCYILEERWTKL
jgi:hypothetical protein